ncbi:MAG TPA: UPF0223 family protein [Virgibacillus sp.]|nr:UPF0223 family protein [Virgibacillus sp.]
MAYSYPIEETWTTEEITDVVTFFSLIEQAYESSVDRKELLAAYRRFKAIVPAKNEERSYFSEFEQSSAYSSYHAVKKARNEKQDKISMR